jgi:hypothetical protein
MQTHYPTACRNGFAVLLLVLAVPAFATGPVSAEKIRVDDGSTCIDAGELQCHVSNWGLIGSHYSSWYFPYHSEPSCRWPGVEGRDHLYGAGIWVGALVDGVPHVTFGQPGSEFTPDPDPAVVPMFSAYGAQGAARYPDPGADDDDDGFVDEDPLDGADNDGDGLVDEDFAAWGDQYLRCEYADPPIENNTSHYSLGLRVVQETFQWTDPAHSSAIGLQYTLYNEGEELLEELYVGYYADVDINGADGPDEPTDDIGDTFVGEVDPGDGEPVPVAVSFAYDGKLDVTSGYLGLILLGARLGDAPEFLEETAPVCGVRLMAADRCSPYPQDPDWDSLAYTGYLAVPGVSYGIDRMCDYRLFSSAGPFVGLAPGDSLCIRHALVAGVDEDELLRNCARFRRTYLGAAFDRDGDPSNGAEHVVRWLRPQDIPVPAVAGRLTVIEARDDSVRLDLFTNVESLECLVLERETADGARRWNAARLAVDGGAALLDTEPGAWPRTYRLLADGDRVLDEIRLAAPVPGAPDIELFAAPNPFNPSLTVEYRLAGPGRAVLSVYDVAGRLVARLADGPREAGQHTVLWDGCDTAGRAAPSGAYHLRLEAGGRVIGKTVSLVR